MDTDHLWQKITLGFFICNTLSIAIILETLFLAKPLITPFFPIFAASLYLNLKYFKKKLLPPDTITS